MLGWNRNPLGGLLLLADRFEARFASFEPKGFFQIGTTFSKLSCIGSKSGLCSTSSGPREPMV
jgi:hypothetical protein